MEFQLTSPIELQPLEFNFEQLKAYLDERLEVYRGLIVSQDGIKAAKSDRAKLNKFKDALKSQRLDVKRTFMKPFDEFDAKVNELVVMVDKPINAIDEQIKRFEDADKAEKRAQIEEHFNSAIGELKDIFTLDKIYNPRWMNVTYKLKDIEDEITETITKLRNNIRIIQVMKLPFEQEVLNVLLDTQDMSAALSRKNALEAQAEALKAFVPELPVKHVQVTAQETLQETVQEIVHETVQTSELEQIDFRVWVTAEQKRELREWFISRGIRYGKVPERSF